MAEEDVGGGGGLGPHSPAPCPSPGAPAETTSPGTTRHLPRGIVIQLTEGDWDSVDDGELIFSLERDGDFPSLFLPSESHVSQEDRTGLRCPAFHVPFSPSSSGSLGDCGAVSPGFLSPGPGSPTQRPQASLFKSLSDEAELKDNSTLRSRPLLSLVKSISSEISRSEPEVSQSKSDSRLNLHLWKQLTQHKACGNGDSRTAPPSPNSTSPTGDVSKGSFFKMELEDTKRKLSEAVQEPLSSMFSKIMREESVSSPKHQSRSQTSNQACSSGARGAGREAVTDPSGLSDSPVRNALPVFDWPVLRPSGRSYHGMCPVHNSRGDMEICGDSDVIQVAAVEAQRQPPKWQPEPRTRSPPQPQPPLPPLPRTTLLCVALLSYGYFTLPLSSYMSGLALGLAFGFVLGLVLIMLGSFSACCSANVSGAAPDVVAWNRLCTQPSGLKGWMNEIYDYDPETYHPSLTHSVFVTLEASRLRLDYPQCNISRRATYDERIHESTFINSRFYQLAHSKVLLLPCVLARKRLWNPKYPICLQLEGSVSPEDKGGPERSQGDEPTIELANQGQPTKPNQNMPTVLYLFGRTGREKEEWFRHFLLASQSRSKRHSRCASRSGDHPVVRSASLSPPAQGSCGYTRVGSTEDEAPSINIFPSTSNHRGRSQLDYPTYMSRLLAMEQLSPLASPAANSTETRPSTQARCTCDLPEWEGGQTAWANALIGRIFWDFLREKHWVYIVSHKIQKKLSKIRLPYFMNELSLTELDMGSCMPQITSASSAEVDHRGVWLKVKLVYTGALQMTLQTNFNLSRLGKEGIQDTHCLTETGSLGRARSVLTVLADSDEESSSAGSSDEEELLLSEGLSAQCPMGDKGVPAGLEGAASGRTGRKILRFVDKIAKSKYFQKATENEFIKKKFEEMSNTPLLLAVEVQELSGTLVINIPPPPTDRIWYSFCVPPKLDLHVRPKLGEREVTICHVTDWIQKKLQDEFQKVIVLPNMDDIYLPLMHSGMNIPQISQDQNCHSLRSRNSSTESIERIPSEISGANSD